MRLVPPDTQDANFFFPDEVTNNNSLSDLEYNSPHPRTCSSTRKGHLQARRQEKSSCGKIQPSGIALLLVSVDKQDDWESEVMVPALRRSSRKKPERNYVISFPATTDTEDNEDDGIEYGFRWDEDGC